MIRRSRQQSGTLGDMAPRSRAHCRTAGGQVSSARSRPCRRATSVSLQALMSSASWRPLCRWHHERSASSRINPEHNLKLSCVTRYADVLMCELLDRRTSRLQFCSMLLGSLVPPFSFVGRNEGRMTRSPSPYRCSEAGSRPAAPVAGPLQALGDTPPASSGSGDGMRRTPPARCSCAIRSETSVGRLGVRRP